MLETEAADNLELVRDRRDGDVMSYALAEYHQRAQTGTCFERDVSRFEVFMEEFRQIVVYSPRASALIVNERSILNQLRQGHWRHEPQAKAGDERGQVADRHNISGEATGKVAPANLTGSQIPGPSGQADLRLLLWSGLGGIEEEKR